MEDPAQFWGTLTFFFFNYDKLNCVFLLRTAIKECPEATSPPSMTLCFTDPDVSETAAL